MFVSEIIESERNCNEVLINCQKESVMSRKCEICNKSTIYGKSGIHKHSGLWRRRAPKTARQWKPNLKRVKMLIKGKVKKAKICVKCLKSSKVVQKNTI